MRKLKFALKCLAVFAGGVLWILARMLGYMTPTESTVLCIFISLSVLFYPAPEDEELYYPEDLYERT